MPPTVTPEAKAVLATRIVNFGILAALKNVDLLAEEVRRTPRTLSCA